MPVYTPTTWTNGVTAVNSAHMTNIENQLSAVQYGFNSLGASPYQVINNDNTYSSGTSKTYTVTNVGGITTGAKGVFCNALLNAGTAGGFMSYCPHGTAWNAGNFPSVIAADATHTFGGSFYLPIDSNGQIDVKANSAAMTSVYLWITAFIY